jgi:hypothetical protein
LGEPLRSAVCEALTATLVDTGQMARAVTIATECLVIPKQPIGGNVFTAPALDFMLSLRKLRAEALRASGETVRADSELAKLHDLLSAADDNHPLRTWLAGERRVMTNVHTESQHP